MLINLAIIKKFTDPWIGTKFKQNGNSKRGIDCKNLINNLIHELIEKPNEIIVPIIAHGQEVNAVDLFLQYYPSTEMKAYINGAVIIHKIGSHYTLGMIVDNKTFIHVDESIGVCYRNLADYKRFEYKIFYPNIYNINPVTLKKDINFKNEFIFVNNCKGCG